MMLNTAVRSITSQGQGKMFEECTQCEHCRAVLTAHTYCYHYHSNTPTTNNAATSTMPAATSSVSLVLDSASC